MSDERTIKPNAPADFTPQLGDYKTLQPFRYWCQKVLPLAYDDSLSYYELLCKVIDYLNKTMEDVETLNTDVNSLHTAYTKLQSYVNNYFSTLDVQDEINKKLDEMASNGILYEIIRTYTDPIVNEQNAKIDVLKARMDSFTSLPAGSTSGDAELTDIRVGYNGVTYPTAGDAVRKQIGNLNTGLSVLTKKTINVFNKINFTDENSISFSGEKTHFGNWFLSDYIRVNNLAYISVKLKGYKNSVAPVVFYNDAKEVLSVPQESDYYIINGDFQIECYGFLKIPNNATYVRFNSLSSETENKIIKFYFEMPSPITVSIDSTGDVFTINGAMKAFNYGENVNIFVKNGSYNEVIKFDNHYKSVTLIGESRDLCVIQDGSGVYINSPIVVNGNFLIKNITVKATLENIGAWQPTYNDSDVVNTYPSYALHIDGSGYDSTKQAYGIVENCNIYSEAFPSVGMGVNKNQTVEFINCNIERNCTNPNFRRDEWEGAFYCHNAVAENAYNQFLILRNNTIKCNYKHSCHIKGNVGISIQSGFHFELSAENNNMYSKDVEYSGCKYEKGQSAISGLSHGNSNDSLNTLLSSDTPIHYENIFKENIGTNMGSLQNGTVSPSIGWRYTDYLKPNLGSEIAYKGETVGGAISLAEFYDENYNEIAKYRLSPKNGLIGGKYTIPNDNTIKYVRYCMSLDDSFFNGTSFISADMYLKKEH